MAMSENKKTMTVTQLAKLLGVSRVAIHKRIKKGQIDAVRIGNMYTIPEKEVKKIVGDVKGQPLSKKEKNKIKKIVNKVIYDYGETLKMLAKE